MTLFAVTKDDICTKTQFVQALRKFLKTGKTTVPPHGEYNSSGEYNTSPGETLLVRAIADYFETHTEIPDKEPGINFFVDLHKHLVDAFSEFRTHEKHDRLRELYGEQTNGHMPDLFDARGGATRARVVYDLCKLMPLIAGRMGGDEFRHRLHGFFDWQENAIKAAWGVFLRECYRPLAPRIKKNLGSYKGLFGRTWLWIDSGSGRMMYTFERMVSIPDVKILDQLTAIAENRHTMPVDKYAAIEVLLMTRQQPTSTRGRYEISFSADESDLIGTRSGMNTPGSAITDYKACVEMIEDVVAHWDPDKFVEK